MKFSKSELNKVKRGAKKATYNKKKIYQILDAKEIYNVAFIYRGRAFVQPKIWGRWGFDIPPRSLKKQNDQCSDRIR